MSGSERDLVEFLKFMESMLTSTMVDLGAFANDMADKVEHGFNLTADSVRRSVRGISWVPESMKPAPPRPPPPPTPAALSLRSMQRVQVWVDNHRALTAAIIAFIGTTTFLLVGNKRRSRRSGRARRKANGAKTELVVIAGSPFSPATRSIALDLERRGFLVYIAVGSLEEEQAVADYRAADVRSLNFDITSPNSTLEMLEKLNEYINNPRRHGTRRLHLASLVVMSSFPSTHPVGPTASIPAGEWYDALSSHLIYPISITTAFLPLLSSESVSAADRTSPADASSPPDPPTSLVFINTSTISAIHPPQHAVESVTTAGITSFLTTLRSELPRNIPVTQLCLGGHIAADLLLNQQQKQQQANESPASAVTRRYTPGEASPSPSSSSPSSKSASTSASPAGRKSRSRPLLPRRKRGGGGVRELHGAVFAAVVGHTSGTVFVGRGARTYALVGAWAPRPLVEWMLGYRPAAAKADAAFFRPPWARVPHSEGSGSASGVAGSRSGSGSGVEAEQSGWEKIGEA